jgi:hypothetical protein
VKFAYEALPKVWAEVMLLAEMHWKETEMYRRGQEFAPKKDTYFLYAERELFLLFTARVEGALVGYAGMYLMPSMHSAVLIATEDTWYLHPEHRKGRNAIRFVQFVENELRQRGAVELWMNAKIANGAGRILEYLDYAAIATRYYKALSEEHYVRTKSACNA